MPGVKLEMQTVASNSSKSSGTHPSHGSIFPHGYMIAFGLTTMIFFVWGMSNNLTDILVQQFKKSFELSLVQAQLVQTSVFLAYFVMATPAALLMRRFGYKVGLVVGLTTFAVGTLMFWPAAIIGQYTPFLIALFVVGSGSSILETAANPLVAQFGDQATSERRLNFSQAFNPPGTIFGALFGTWFIFSGVEKSAAEVAAMKAQGSYDSYLHSEILRVVPTYVVLGVAVLLLAFFVGRAKFPASIDSSADAGPDSKIAPVRPGAYGRLFRNPGLVFAVVAQFFNVGAQISVWSNLIPYMRTYTSVGDKTAGYFLTGTLVALCLGRIISTPLMKYVSPAKMIGFYAVANLFLCIAAAVHPGMAGAMAIVMTSFFMSVMFPTIFALGVKDLGDDTKIAGSLLVMAILGGAIFPPLLSLLGRQMGGLAFGYVLPAAAYIVVAAYGFMAPRLGNGGVDVHGVDVAPQNV